MNSPQLAVVALALLIVAQCVTAATNELLLDQILTSVKQNREMEDKFASYATSEPMSDSRREIILRDYVTKRSKLNEIFESLNKSSLLSFASFVPLITQPISVGRSVNRKYRFKTLNKQMKWNDPIQIVVPVDAPSIEMLNKESLKKFFRLSSTTPSTTGVVSTEETSSPKALIQDPNPYKVDPNTMNRYDRIILITQTPSQVSRDQVTYKIEAFEFKPCRNQEVGKRFAFPDSDKFLVCLHEGTYTIQQCPARLEFNEEINSCDYHK